MRSRISAGPQIDLRMPSITLILLGALMLAANPVLAQWSVAPSISAGLQYDDNPILIEDETFASSING